MHLRRRHRRRYSDDHSDTAGTGGNAFTLAASANATAAVSSATLIGGGYRHEWLSGKDDIPSHTVEIGHPKLATPVFFRHLGTVIESLAFEMGQEGPANGSCSWWRRGRRRPPPPSMRRRSLFAPPLQPGPRLHPPRRRAAGRGHRRQPHLLQQPGAGAGHPRRRQDRGAEPTFASATGAMTVRFDGATLVAEAANGDPVALEYGFTTADGW